MEENQAVQGLDNLFPEKKRQLLAPLLQKQKMKNAPLSFGQKHLCCLHQMDKTHAAYDLQSAVRLPDVGSRHESLRAAIVPENGRSQPKNIRSSYDTITHHRSYVTAQNKKTLSLRPLCPLRFSDRV